VIESTTNIVASEIEFSCFMFLVTFNAVTRYNTKITSQAIAKLRWGVELDLMVLCKMQDSPSFFSHSLIWIEFLISSIVGVRSDACASLKLNVTLTILFPKHTKYIETLEIYSAPISW